MDCGGEAGCLQHAIICTVTIAVPQPLGLGTGPLTTTLHHCIHLHADTSICYPSIKRVYAMCNLHHLIAQDIV